MMFGCLTAALVSAYWSPLSRLSYCYCCCLLLSVVVCCCLLLFHQVAPGQRCPTSRRTMFQYYVKTLKPKPIAVVKGGSLTTEGFRVQLEDREWKGKLMTNDEGQRIVRLDSEMVLENRAEAAKETMVAHFVEMVKREADVAALVGEIAEINSRLLEV